MNESIVMPVRCNDDECGMESAYRFWKDGSFKRVLDACWHPKRLPDRERIARAFASETPPSPGTKPGATAAALEYQRNRNANPPQARTRPPG